MGKLVKGKGSREYWNYSVKPSFFTFYPNINTMKTLLLSVLALGLSLTAAAQQKTAAAEATSATRTLANDLQLDEGAYLKVKEAYSLYFQKREELNQQLANDKAALAEALKKEETELDNRLRGVLNTRQYTLYSEAKSR